MKKPPLKPKQTKQKPPKKPAGGKRSGKPSSKSKAIREEEKALQEEEEQRLKVEQEEKEKLEAQEKKRREIELNQHLEALLVEQSPQTQMEIEAIDKLFEKPANYVKPDPEWERYTNCNRKPDPTSKTEINTFITITKEKKEADKNEVLEETNLILEMISQLKLIKEDPEQADTEDQVKKHEQTIKTLEELLMLRYNEATLKILKNATYEADPDSGNLQKVFEGKNETFYIWGNLNKNARFKSYEFSQDIMRFEIPKVLATADFANQGLETIGEEPIVTVDENTSEKPSATFVPIKASPGTSSASSITSTRSKLALKHRRPGSGKKKKTALKSEKKEEQEKSNSTTQNIRSMQSAPDMNRTRHERSVTYDGNQTESCAEKTPPPQESKIRISAVDVTAAEAASLLNGIVDEVAAMDETLDLRIYTRLGEIYHLNLLEMPPQPKSIRGWTLRQIIDKPLMDFSYSASDTSVRQQTPVGTPNFDHVSEERRRSSEIESSNSLGLSFALPSTIFFVEKPQVAIWDKTNCHWKTNAISDITYGENKSICFKTKTPGIFALFQKTYINMPFRSWEIRPKAENCCYLIISGPKTEVEFEFKESKCRLNRTGPFSSCELNHLFDKWFEVNELITEMQSSGLNFFPPEDAKDILNVQIKLIDLNRLYHEMAILSSSCAFGWSKWNCSAPLDQVVIKAAAFCVSGSAHDYDQVPDEDWSHFLVSTDRCYKLHIPKNMSEFEANIHESATHNCDLLHALRLTPLCGDTDNSNLNKIFKRSQDVDKHYAQAVYLMLKTIDPISFS